VKLSPILSALVDQVLLDVLLLSCRVMHVMYDEKSMREQDESGMVV
jgi:hypothetical protein